MLTSKTLDSSALFPLSAVTGEQRDLHRNREYSEGILKEKLMPYVDYGDILRFLHYRKKDIDPSIRQEIDEVLDMVFEKSKFLHVHKKFSITVEEDAVLLQNIVLPYRSLTELFVSCTEIYAVACTLGHDISRLIRMQMLSNPAKGVITDSCASMVTDAFAAYIQSTLGYTTHRFSPGYGDVPLTTQQIFAQLLEIEKNIGVHLTEANLMIPEKSIIFLVGKLCTKEEREGLSCKNCPRECIYRKV